MGLDGVELVMAVEEEFGLEISDADAEKLRTPRDLIDVVCAKMAAVKPGGVCQSQHAFYQLRRALCRQTGQPRKTITPATRLVDLLPTDMREPAWQKLRDAIQPERWPSPVRSPGLVRGVMNAVCLAGIVAAFAVIPGSWGKIAPDSFAYTLIDACGLLGARLLLLLAVSGTLGVLAVLLTRSQRRYLPLKCQRVGELAKLVRKREPDAALPPDKVAAKVRDIVMEQLGVSAERYREDADFVKDFGMG